MMLSCVACGDAENKTDNPANDNQQSSDQEDETPSYLDETPTIVVSGSDFQSYGSNDAQDRAESAGKTFSAILSTIKKDYARINGFLLQATMMLISVSMSELRPARQASMS